MAMKSSPLVENKLTEIKVIDPQVTAPKLRKPHHVGHRQRLKAKFDRRGEAAFHDYELLELLLFYAIPRVDVKPIAKDLLTKCGSLLGVFGASAQTLKEVKGAGESVVHILKLVHTLIGRSMQENLQGKTVLQSWHQVIEYCTARMSYNQQEQLRLLFLDQKNQLISDEVQQVGTVNHTPIYPREVMRRALEVNASALILVHNHPSGDPAPSKADIELTLKIQEIGAQLGIKLHDHIVIGKGKHNSFKAMGLL
ncbi:RadC family protein [Candidatus Paracaedibacter symbiosus]|uniref:RadC family protein n=1 Tax=Candidatus Paracaedibacter symbiosus TaxID=244582 RepID=UPI00068EC24E|nr:DNA repair protein RadC [Candidatus Paracaedibacter symbiosus]